ncbi:CynX/NimT family MFS transporter [Marinobacter algicola]|uniref:MFS transporter n=1 Tax=Marinobacter algicola TaxID=236100 RepID=UPI003BAB6F5A
MAAGVLAAAQVGKMPAALPVLQSQLSLSLVQVGWIATAISAVSAFLGLASGLVCARLGTRPALLLGLGVIALGSLLGALSPTGTLLLSSRILEGAGFVLVVVSAPSIVAAAASPARRATWMSVWGCYMPVGVSIMLVLTPLLIEAGGWRLVWWCNVGLLTGVLAFAWMQRHHLPHKPALAGVPLRGQLRHASRLSGPWLMGLAFMAYSAQWFMIITWLPSFAVEHMGLSLRYAGLLTAFATFANIIGCLSVSLVARAGMPRWAVAVSVHLLLGTVGLAVFSAALDPSLRMVLAIVGCGLSGLLPATMFAGVPALARSPEEVGLGNGIIIQCANVGIFLGPPAIAAVVAHLGGWESGRWLFPVLASAGILAGLALRAHERRDNKSN